MNETSYEWDINGWPNTLRSIRELYMLRYNFLYQSLYLLFIRILYSMIGPMICMGVPIPVIYSRIDTPSVSTILQQSAQWFVWAFLYQSLEVIIRILYVIVRWKMWCILGSFALKHNTWNDFTFCSPSKWSKPVMSGILRVGLHHSAAELWRHIGVTISYTNFIHELLRQQYVSTILQQSDKWFVCDFL